MTEHWADISCLDHTSLWVALPGRYVVSAMQKKHLKRPMLERGRKLQLSKSSRQEVWLGIESLKRGRCRAICVPTSLICFHFPISPLSCVRVFKSVQVHTYVWMCTHVYAWTHSGQRKTLSVLPKLSATWVLLFASFWDGVLIGLELSKTAR